jgi:F-type H+-transporting ATPase subunit b
VEAILHNLGIEPSALIIQGIGFILMYLILKKFVFGHIGAALETRKKDIQDRMDKLEADQKELDRLQEEVRQKLTEIELEAKSRIQTAIDQANTERDKIMVQAHKDSDRELEKARQTIQREKNVAVADLRSQVGGIAMQIAERVLNNALDASQHQKVIDELIEQLPTSNE